MPLRFHWRLPAKTEKSVGVNFEPKMLVLPDIEAELNFCRRAEESSIDSLLKAFGYYRPYPILLSTALGMEPKS